MNNVINLTDEKVKRILGSMSDIVINPRKRERLLGGIMKTKGARVKK